MYWILYGRLKSRFRILCVSYGAPIRSGVIVWVPLRLPLSGTGALWSEGKYDSSPGQPKRMRKVAVLLTLTMLLTSLAGCAGDDESASPVGEWWKGDGMIMHIIEDGTLTDGEGNSGTWSTEGDILTITIDEANEDEEGVHWFNYAVEISPGIEWMWLQMLDDDDDYVPYRRFIGALSLKKRL